MAAGFLLSLAFGIAAAWPLDLEQRSVPAIQSVSAADWQKLNNTVGGRLARGVPMAQPCYSIYNGAVVTPNLTECANVQNNYGTDLFIASHYGGYPTSNWANCQASGQSCALDTSLPTDPTVYVPPNQCYQGSVSPYYIPVSSVSDVQAALAFAKAKKVPLVIKNSGHDYKGRSAAPNSLALWTHTLMAGPTLVKDFVPDGCKAPVGDGVTFGAGQNFNNLYLFAEANNVTVVGGSSRTVGIGGGWITGAGHSSISNTLGLGVDNVMQIRGVLPNGTYVTANECQNQDMWYAWRGGGGSTFGVNIEMTTRVHPQLTLQVAYFALISLDPTALKQFITLCVQNAAKWADEGWGGYIEPAAKSQQASGFVLTTPKLTLAEATASMKPIFDFAAKQIATNASVKTVNSYYEYFSTYILPNQEIVDVGIAVGSRLIPRAQFIGAKHQTALIGALMNMTNTLEFPADILDPRTTLYGAPLQILVTAPSSYPTTALNDTSSVTPAWRTAVWHVIAGQAFSNQATAAQTTLAYQTASTATDFLRALPLTSGAYQNEADTFEPDPAGTFWGAKNYKRLLKIKKEVDPGNILTCHQCIGWNSGDARYGCYPKV